MKIAELLARSDRPRPRWGPPSAGELEEGLQRQRIRNVVAARRDDGGRRSPGASAEPLTLLCSPGSTRSWSTSCWTVWKTETCRCSSHMVRLTWLTWLTCLGSACFQALEV